MVAFFSLQASHELQKGRVLAAKARRAYKMALRAKNRALRVLDKVGWREASGITEEHRNKGPGCVCWASGINSKFNVSPNGLRWGIKLKLRPGTCRVCSQIRPRGLPPGFGEDDTPDDGHSSEDSEDTLARDWNSDEELSDAEGVWMLRLLGSVAIGAGVAVNKCHYTYFQRKARDPRSSTARPSRNPINQAS